MNKIIIERYTPVLFTKGSTMWDTPDGIRTLSGAEANLIRDGATLLLDEIRQEAEYAEQFEYGVPEFDRLTWQQRLAVLYRVVDALLNPAVEAPERCAVNDAAIAVIFGVVKLCVGDEIGDPDRPGDWKRLLLDCAKAQGLRPRLKETCKNWEKWEDLLRDSREKITWDSDFELSDLFSDATEIYYAEPTPDPTDDEIPDIVNGLKRLLGWRPGVPEA